MGVHLKVWMFMSLVGYTFCLKTVCEFESDSSPGYGYTNFSTVAYAQASSLAVTGNFPTYNVLSGDLSSAGMIILKDDTTAGLPEIQVEFYTEIYDVSTSPDQFKIFMIFTHLDTSSSTVTDLSMSIDISPYLKADWTGVPLAAYRRDRDYVQYNYTTPLNPTNDSVSLEFVAEPTGAGGTDLPEGETTISGTVYFTHNSVDYGIFYPRICVWRDTTVKNDVIYQHGFTVLVFFILFFAGIGLTILFIWLFFMLQRRRKSSSVSPSKSEEKRYRDKGKKIVMDAKAAIKKGMTNTIKDFSLIAWNDSIVLILAMKDKLHMFREMDNLDILSTIHVDTDMETEQNDQSVQASMLLVQGLRFNGDVTKQAEDKANSNMQNRLKELDKKLDADYKKDLESVYTDAEAKNKEKLGELMRKHREQRQEVVRIVKDLPDEEKKQMIELMDEQKQTEEDELTFKLSLEQNEEAEKLRKEYSIRKRMGIKDVQQHYITDVINEGQLNSQKAEWLMKLHKQQQEEIHRKYDEEISKQRMNLEEKLARRRALAHASETQEDDSTEVLNTIASLHVNLIQKMKKSRHLSPDQIEDYMNQTKLDLQNVKTKMDAEMETQEGELFKKLSTTKRKTLAEKIAEHQKELQEYINKSKAQQTEGPVDPVSYVDGLVDLKSRHRKEMNTLENQIDRDHSQQLEELRDRVTQNAVKELEGVQAELVKNLKEDGVRDDAIQKMLQNHEQTVDDLRKKQLNNRRNQEAKLKDDLARRKREWEQKKEQEKKEQHELREHEAEIVDKLLGSQVSISESEKDRIMKEHEKQMVKLENSLTLSKLKQRRMLEEKIAQKRARQMEELEKKQNAEVEKQRRIAENNGEEDDDVQRQVETMKKHVQQKIALAQGQQLNMDEELDDIRVEMTKDRALALKDQEERLGALIASLQMDKARELAKIEEQQKAINNLKSNLMDDLNARGDLSTKECQKILNVHKEEQDNINKKLDGQRAKHEKALRAKLQQRMEQREQSILFKQDEEMQTLINKVTNKTAAKIRSAILTNKHMVEMEKFRNKMDRDISQTLADTRREFEIQKQKIAQEQELKFISGLVKVGQFSRNELLDVLHMLFPGKTEEGIQKMMNTLSEGAKLPDDNEKGVQSSLADRIYTDKYSNPTPLHRRGSVITTTDNDRGSSQKKKKGKKQFGPQEDFGRKSSLRSSLRSQQQQDEYPSRNDYSIMDEPTRRQSKKYSSEYDYDDYQDRADPRTAGYSNRGYRDDEYEDDYDNRYNDRYNDNYNNDRYDDRVDDRYNDRYGDRYDDRSNGRYDDDRYDDEYDDNGRPYRSQNTSQKSSGRLPPLRDQGGQPGRKQKKGKLLKKMAHSNYSDDDIL